jgi:hypothetical protein
MADESNEHALVELRERLTRAERGRDVAIANRDALGKSWHEIALAIGGIPLHDCPKDVDPCPECQKTLADLVMQRIAELEAQMRGMVRRCVGCAPDQRFDAWGHTAGCYQGQILYATDRGMREGRTRILVYTRKIVDARELLIRAQGAFDLAFREASKPAAEKSTRDAFELFARLRTVLG